MSRRIWMASIMALVLVIPVGASGRTVLNESGTVSQLSVSWSGEDEVSTWWGDASARVVDGVATVEVYGETVTRISDNPECWRVSTVAGYTGPGTMTVAKKNGSAHATAILDGYESSFEYCDDEFQNWTEEFRPVEVAIDFTATSAPERLTRSESTRVPGTSNQHSRIAGESRNGDAVVTYDDITRNASGYIFTYRYSMHADAMQLVTAAVDASTSPVFNENGDITQLVVYWSGTDGVNSWEGDATAYMLNGVPTVELWAHTIDQVSWGPNCWEEVWVSGLGPASMTVAKKNGAAYATAMIDAYVMSYVFCEPTYEPQDEKQEFRTVEVAIDFTATSAAEKVTLRESWKRPGEYNQHASISGERRTGFAQVIYDDVTMSADFGMIFSFKYSFHSNQSKNP